MEFSVVLWNFMDFYGEIIVWDRSHKNHFYGTGPVILGPVPLNWDRSPTNVFKCGFYNYFKIATFGIKFSREKFH